MSDSIPRPGRTRFRAHPWHGVPVGDESPEHVTCYIEIVPTDTVKYELDKPTGLLRIDRPQKYSNVCPTLYGFLPQTYCAERVARYCGERTGRAALVGDGDPLDVCVLSERAIPHGNVLVSAIPIGGLRMLDGNLVDDKILAVLAGDVVHGGLTEISGCPPALVDRLRHYFLTYKQGPDARERVVEIAGVYGREEAHTVIRLSQQDYRDHFGGRDDSPASAPGDCP